MQVLIKKGEITTKISFTELILYALVVVALVLGYGIYSKYHKYTVPANAPSQGTNPDKGSSMKLQQSETYLKSLSDEEKEALKTPMPNASEDEKKKHFEISAKAAKTADFLDVSNCEIRPVVLKLTENEEFIAKNDNNVDRKIIIDTEHTYTVPANGETKITATFGHGKGLYGYGCDLLQQPGGLFFVN
jgi:hypothetical protein